jgi:hypothetical protein
MRPFAGFSGEAVRRATCPTSQPAITKATPPWKSAESKRLRKRARTLVIAIPKVKTAMPIRLGSLDIHSPARVGPMKANTTEARERSMQSHIATLRLRILFNSLFIENATSS